VLLGVPALGLVWLSARARPVFENEPSLPAKTAPRRGKARQPEPEPEEETDSPRFFDLAIGFAAHSFYGARAALRRVFQRRKQDQSLPVRSWQGGDFEPQLDRSIPVSRQPERGEPPLSRDWDQADD